MKEAEFCERLVKRKLLLPPLAGYTDFPFRRILAEFSPPFICTEMTSSQAVVSGGMKVHRTLEKPEGDHLNGVQLFGGDPAVMAQAAMIVEELGFDYIDINMGCIVRKISGNDSGISLMEDVERAVDISSSVVNAVNVPVTCKIRLGVTSGKRNAVSLAKKLSNVGVAAITVHGRTGENKFGLPVDHIGIREVVDKVDLPVIANGGVFTGEDAIELFEKTGASAVMPGRGIIGNPWLVNEIEAAFSSEPYVQASIEERKSICLRHLQHVIDFYGEQNGVNMFRRILPRYFAGCRNIWELKNESQKITTTNQVQNLLNRIHANGLHSFFI